MTNLRSSLFLILFTIIGFTTTCQVNNFLCKDSNFNKTVLIGIGEVSHGSISDYEFRERFIKCLLEDSMPIDVFIEMPHFAGILIEEYYKNKVSVDSLVDGFIYYGLQTDGFLNFVNAFRGNQLVTFYGIDMQSQNGTLQGLVKAIKEKEIISNTIIDAISDSLSIDFLFQMTKDEYALYQNTVSRNLEQLKNIIKLIDTKSSNWFLEVDFPLTIICQYFEMIDFVKKNGDIISYRTHREKSMADNIIEIQRYRNNKSIYLAANGHVANTHGQVSSTGYYLREALGEKYFIIATQYLKGSLLEVDVENGERKIVEHPLDLRKNTLPYEIYKTEKLVSESLIIFNNVNGPLIRKLKKKILTQDFGTGRSKRRGKYRKDGYCYYIPIEELDAIYFIYQVNASKNYYQ